MKGLQLQRLNSNLRKGYETLTDTKYSRVVTRADVLPKLDYSLCGFSSVHGDKIAVFEVYLDESGTHNDRGLVVAGYVADANKWADFAVTWKAILTEYHLSYFHMKSFRSRHDRAFKHLSRRQKDDLLRCLITCIRDTALLGTMAIVRPHEYVRLTTPEFRSFYGSSYTLCVGLCVSGVLRYLPELKASSERVGIFLEQGHKNVGQALEAIKETKRHLEPTDLSDVDSLILNVVGRPYPDQSIVGKIFRQFGYRIGAFGQGSHLDMLPLQAADMLAYCFYSQSARKDERFCTEVLNAIDERVPLYTCPFEPAAIQQFIARAREDEETGRMLRDDSHSLVHYLRSFGIDAKKVPGGGVSARGNLEEAWQRSLQWKKEQSK